MNEHGMQEVLTGRWLKNGPVIQGQALFLAAWEVMITDWRMNRWGGSWSPSIDFWFLDQNGGCWLLEFKPELTSPAKSVSALCQVTHRAGVFARSYQFSKLERVYQECRQTSPRSDNQDSPTPLLEAHREYFQLRQPLASEQVGSLPFQRVIGAQRLGDGFQTALTAFEGRNHTEIVEMMRQSGYKINLENKRDERTRFMSLGDWGSTLTPSILSIETGPLSVGHPGKI